MGITEYMEMENTEMPENEFDVMNSLLETLGEDEATLEDPADFNARDFDTPDEFFDGYENEDYDDGEYYK